jgi:Na+-transporting methylmalonyl-CoA/oxaloacetate decarboxylase gamma subunit
MDAQTQELLAQGLLITVIGMSLVFAALGLLWMLIALLNRGVAEPEASPATIPVSAEEREHIAAITAERARVAAIAAATLLSSATPLLLEAPIGPAFEHGRTAPSWVTTNRAIALEPWRPPRTR